MLVDMPGLGLAPEWMRQHFFDGESMTLSMKAMREGVAARVLCKVGERRVYSSVMNCSFDNPKSSRFFPRLRGEEERNNGLDYTRVQEG